MKDNVCNREVEKVIKRANAANGAFRHPPIVCVIVLIVLDRRRAGCTDAHLTITSRICSWRR